MNNSEFTCQVPLLPVGWEWLALLQAESSRRTPCMNKLTNLEARVSEQGGNGSYVSLGMNLAELYREV